MPGADADSPKRIRDLAHDLPRSVFMEAVATVQERQPANPCGLLVHLLRIVRAERAAAFSARLAADLGQSAVTYAPAPWTIDALKRTNPERYTRIVAKTMPDELIRVALEQHHRDVDDFLELAAAVRRGDEQADPIGPAEQEARRWLEELADQGQGLPPRGDLADVVARWQNLDAVARDDLLAFADTLRERVADAGAEAA